MVIIAKVVDKNQDYSIINSDNGTMLYPLLIMYSMILGNSIVLSIKYILPLSKLFLML